MKDNIVAIDLGSSNTGIYQVGAGVVLYEPTVVALSADGRKKVKEVGIEAKKLIGKTADSTEVKMPIFESEIEDADACALMLEKFLNKITLRKLSSRPQVVFSVPCGAETPTLRRAEKLLNACNIPDYSFVESPVLSALGLGIPLTDASPRFIVDIGGGSTEIAAVSLDGIICGITVNMGGISVDAMLINYIEENYGLKIGSLTAEKTKLSIGSLLPEDSSRMVLNGRDIQSGRPRALTLCCSDIIEPIEAFFNKIFQLMSMVMSKLPAEVSADIRRTGVYFSGGASKTVGLEDYFKKQMGMRANIFQDAELAVTLGGGVVASDKALLKKLGINKRR